MAQANRYTGKNLYMTLGGVVISADYKSVSEDESTNAAEGTAGADGHEYSIPTYRTTSVDVELMGLKKADAGYTNIMAQTTPGAAGALVVGPEGNTSGLPRFTYAGFVEKRGREFKNDDTVTLKFTYRCTAAAVENTW